MGSFSQRPTNRRTETHPEFRRKDFSRWRCHSRSFVDWTAAAKCPREGLGLLPRVCGLGFGWKRRPGYRTKRELRIAPCGPRRKCHCPLERKGSLLLSRRPVARREASGHPPTLQQQQRLAAREFLMQ